MVDAQLVKASELAERYPPGRAQWYPKLKRYVKRAFVIIEEVGVVDLLLVWKAQGVGWHLTVLVSTPPGGVQAGMNAWHARWLQKVVARGVAPNQETELGAFVVPMPGVRGALAACGSGAGGVQRDAG